ncbi:MAG: hypothetical protein ABWW65_05270 [Thermoprotei archaeon]
MKTRAHRYIAGVLVIAVTLITLILVLKPYSKPVITPTTRTVAPSSMTHINTAVTNTTDIVTRHSEMFTATNATHYTYVTVYVGNALVTIVSYHIDVYVNRSYGDITFSLVLGILNYNCSTTRIALKGVKYSIIAIIDNVTASISYSEDLNPCDYLFSEQQWGICKPYGCGSILIINNTIPGSTRIAELLRKILSSRELENIQVSIYLVNLENNASTRVSITTRVNEVRFIS